MGNFRFPWTEEIWIPIDIHGIDEHALAVLGGALRDAADLVSWGAPSIKAVSDFLGNHAPDGETYLNGRI